MPKESLGPSAQTKPKPLPVEQKLSSLLSMGKALNSLPLKSWLAPQLLLRLLEAATSRVHQALFLVAAQAVLKLQTPAWPHWSVLSAHSTAVPTAEDTFSLPQTYSVWSCVCSGVAGWVTTLHTARVPWGRADNRSPVEKR